jgi:hypothetical protein
MKAIIITITTILLLLIIFGISSCAKQIYKNVYYKTRVINKTVITANCESYYLIIGKHNNKIEPFADDDAGSRLKFNSTDIYAELKVGKIYCFKTNWFRSPLFSWYKNILEIAPMSKCNKGRKNEKQNK